MADLIEKRARKWYAVLDVPKALRPRIGRRRFVKSLEVESRAAALRRAGPIVAAWRAEIARARGEPDEDAAFWRRALAQAETPAQRSAILDATSVDAKAALWHDLLRSAPPERRAAILEAIEREAWNIGAENVDRIGELPSTAPEARNFYARASGQIVGFTDHLDEWLDNSQLAEKTKHMQRADIRRFAAKHASVKDVTRASVQRWAASLITDDGIAPKTMQRILPALRGYWKFLQAIGAAPEDAEPFSKLELPKAPKRERREAFTPKDVTKLWALAEKQGDQELADLIDVGRYTGMRIEEIASNRIEKNEDGFLRIEDAKTPAGWRQVPIHSRLATTIARLKGERRTGYLFAHLTANKFGDRSNAIGKRFGRLKKDAGYGPTFVFHSVRKGVATQLQNAGVIEATAAEILGHDKGSGPLSYGLYSAGASLEVKRDAIEKLSYPAV